MRLTFSLLGHSETVRTGLCFTADVFFISPWDLRAPSADRHETLPHRKLGALYNTSPKIGGLPEKILRPKACKISVNFELQTLITSISGMDQHIENQKSNWSTVHAYSEKDGKSIAGTNPNPEPYTTHDAPTDPKRPMKRRNLCAHYSSRLTGVRSVVISGQTHCSNCSHCGHFLVWPVQVWPHDFGLEVLVLSTQP